MNNKTKFSLLIFLLSVFIFSSCSNIFFRETATVQNKSKSEYPKTNSRYGSFLAGKVSHLRSDHGLAASYYSLSLSLDPSSNIVNSVYMMLAFEGRIPEAAIHAKNFLNAGGEDNLANIIVFLDYFSKKQYDDAIKSLDGVKGDIKPLLTVWAFVEEGKKEEAYHEISELIEKSKNEPLYVLHQGMLGEYYNDFDIAEESYQKVLNNFNTNISFRSVEIISNFYLVRGDKDKAISIVKNNYKQGLLQSLYKNLEFNIKYSNPKQVKKIVDSANIGVGEALFSVAATVGQDSGSTYLSQVLISSAIYINKDFDLAKLIFGDSMQFNELYDKAIYFYDSVSKDSSGYFLAQLNKANTYNIQKKYKDAEKTLKSLARDNPNNFLSLLALADAYRMQENYKDAIKYYNLAIDNLDSINSSHWLLYYVLGASYEKNGEWDKAEKNFEKAKELSEDNMIVDNHLGYSWIEQGKNVEKAFAMIVNSYNKAPNNGPILDSLGWAFYRLGMYSGALSYLEKASELEPANAVIVDHLGDVYWQVGRKIEAGYMWERGLLLDKSKELDEKLVKDKLENGLKEIKVPDYDVEKIKEIINTIKGEVI